METDIFRTVAKLLVMIGIFLVIIGSIFFFMPYFDFFKGKEIKGLPGDILIKRDNFVFYFPVATSLLLSVIFTVILNFLAKVLKK